MCTKLLQYRVDEHTMADPLQDMPILNLSPGMAAQLPIGLNDDHNVDATSSQIGVHDVHIQLEQTIHRI